MVELTMGDPPICLAKNARNARFYVKSRQPVTTIFTFHALVR